jgi:hypothetical protein
MSLIPPWASLRASLLPAIFPRFRFFSLFFCRRRVFPSGRSVFLTTTAAGGGVLSSTRIARCAARFVVPHYSSIAVMNFDTENNNAGRPVSREAAALWENTKLRDEINEYLDETVLRRFCHYNVEKENEYLRDAIDWESSPISPIQDWLGVSWRPLDLSTATDAEVSSELYDLLKRLRRLNHEIWRADHLSDRRLYELLVCRLLPCKMKRLSSPRSPYVWNFAFYTEHEFLDSSDDAIWLTYYATPEERLLWSQEHNVAPPQPQKPKYAHRWPSLNGGCDCR